MTLDEWVDLIKTTIGPSEFKSIGVAFLREYFSRNVLYSDGKGDGGADAWVVFESEPPVHVAGQFHAGKSQEWHAKLEADLETFCKYRDAQASDHSGRTFRRMFFVTSQVIDAASAEARIRDFDATWGVSVAVYDARAIAALALENKTALWSLLAQRLPGYGDTKTPSPREEALAAFSFFHDKPAKYRWAVAKSAIATVLHQHKGELLLDQVLTKSASLLQLSEPSRLLERALRDLSSENQVSIEQDRVQARPALIEATRASLAIAEDEKKRLRERCIQIVEPLVPRQKHHKDQIAKQAVDTIFSDLGILVQRPIADQVLYAVDPSKQPRSRYERDAFVRWKSAVNRIEQVLGADEPGHRAIDAVIQQISTSPFAKNLAAAELFAQLTTHDAQEFSQALAASSQRVLLDTSVALPMLCALFDEPVPSWKTSQAALELHGQIKARGGRCVVPSIYLEEMASHLLNARAFADVIESGSELERSRNYFVAHFCSLRSAERRGARQEFLAFLQDFGAPRGPASATWINERLQAERTLRKILERYEIEVEHVTEQTTDPSLPGEPQRDARLLRHDRAVVRELQRWMRGSPSWLVCSADGWLRGVLNDLEITAIDSVGLVDLIDLVRPAEGSRPLLSPMELAASIQEQERELAASVWDAIVEIEGAALRDRDLVRRAAEFRKVWLENRKDHDELAPAWAHFREHGVFRSSGR